ncbi:SIR2 family NAD-dependent protein deacylase [Methylobacterium pseudosasicola]|uniref:Tetratricopeptide repeat-containing protein n=1 Tax=Methylobacterium pseudosasicola TaxID=582667 RepID=A0A1I4PSJ4_9HYPH|nr:SIR2 family protein [Methylobacterium pseudosasicola]SFM30704.1 Tetratricopeptide repeat-containing protein [Methylobacterium pseudosasicola]
MAGRTSRKTVAIPATLVESMKQQRVILFLGAGASMEAGAPSGEALRADLAKKFLGSEMDGYDLMSVAEMAIKAHGNGVVFEHVRGLLAGYEPSEAHKLLPTFRWRTIATTNYDLLVERAYAATPAKLQVPVTFVRDTEPVEERMQSVLNPVEFLKLHGCLEQLHDPDLPPILSHEHYDRYSRNRTRLFARLEDRARESPIVFCGYRIADAHIRKLIYRFAELGGRPRYYIVVPKLSEQEVAYWESMNVGVIDAKFGEFVRGLDRAVEPLFRTLSVAADVKELPVRRLYKVTHMESPRLKAALERDFTYLYQDLPHPHQDPRRFYEGFDTGWGAIVQRLDAKRRLTDDLVFKAVMEEPPASREVRLFVLRGPGGAGKSIALKRAAWDAATQLDALALWFEPAGALSGERLIELHELTGRRIFLFVDRIALHAERVAAALKLAKGQRVPLTVVGAERDTDWNVYCDVLKRFSPHELRVANLSTGEIESLLDLLQRHGSLGLLSGHSRAEQVEAFQQRAERQLLVALHEATQGKHFEDIVFEEYQRIVPEQAQRLYLDIATMNQFVVPVRAGTISRISGIRFEDYERDFFGPLENVVLTMRDPYTGDYQYRARHSRVAQFVFRRACATDDEKSAQLIRIINGLDPGYSTDDQVLQDIVRGRKLSEDLSDVEAGRAVYRAAVAAVPAHAHILQHWAIFEAHHRHGSLPEAEDLARKARDLAPRSNSIIHTQAEIARRRANAERSPVLVEQFRKQAHERLDEVRSSKDPIALTSRCKLVIDEIATLGEALDERGTERGTERELAFFATKVKSAEDLLARARQVSVDDAAVEQVEARLHDVLERPDKALRALERAFSLGAKGAGVAIRLARAYGARGQEDKAVATFTKALERAPDDKLLHLEMAKLLLGTAADGNVVKGHLSRSYSTGDQNFDARHLHAQFLFMTGAVAEAVDLFAEVDRRAPDDWKVSTPRNESLVSKRLGRYSGIVVKRDLAYLFIKSSAYPRDIYGRQDHAGPDDWQALEVGAEMNFCLRFTRSGPVAVDMRPGRVKLDTAA